MKKLNVIIEQGEDGFFAYVQEMEGCTAGGFTYSESKSNILEMIRLAIQEDTTLKKKYVNGYDVVFKLSLESVFNQFPELNIEALTKQTGLRLSVLKSIVEGARMASEVEAEIINKAIQSLATRLQTIRLTR